MSSSGDIRVIAEAMIREERGYANELRGVASRIQHPVLQSLISGIAFDSEKHSVFFESIANLLTKPSALISEEELEAIKVGIKKHIEIEEKMIRLTKELIDSVNDTRLKLILTLIHEDELKHHKALLSIQEIIAEKETLTEEQIWEILWKNVALHGTPGG